MSPRTPTFVTSKAFTLLTLRSLISNSVLVFYCSQLRGS